MNTPKKSSHSISTRRDPANSCELRRSIRRTCFVGADGGGATHRLGSRQVANQVVVGQHALDAERQRNGHCQRQTLRHRHHLPARGYVAEADEVAGCPVRISICRNPIVPGFCHVQCRNRFADLFLLGRAVPSSTVTSGPQRWAADAAIMAPRNNRSPTQSTTNGCCQAPTRMVMA